jgi:hypothetical protein
MCCIRANTRSTVKLFAVQLYVPKCSCGSHTKNSWNWTAEYVNCDVRNRMFNYCLSVKRMQLNNFLTSKSCQCYHPQYHCIICAALAGYKCERDTVFIFYVISCSLAFWYKGPVLESDCRQFYLPKRKNLQLAKAVPPHAMKALGGDEVYLLLILDLGTRWG